MHAPNQLRVVGSHVAAQDGLAKVTGTALYTFDRSLPGMLHAKALRSPHAHARIVNIDTSRAAAMAGVAVVVTAKDLVGLNPLIRSTEFASRISQSWQSIRSAIMGTWLPRLRPKTKR